MSTISITITPNDVGSPTNGVFSIRFNDGARTYDLDLIGTPNVPTSNYFQLVPFEDDTTGEVQAANLGFRFADRYKGIGGTKNLSQVRDGNVITFTARTGTFVSASYSGDWFGILSSINNSVQVDDLSIQVLLQSTGGDCDSLTYVASASGGSGEYSLLNGSSEILSDWDGSEYSFLLSRGGVSSIKAIDGNNNSVSRTVSVPRKLAEGDFKLTSINYENNSDIVLNRVTTIANTAPLQYSLDNISESTGQSYGSSNAFEAVDAGQYKIFIKDKYGCEISKIINVTGFQDSTKAENPNYFSIAEGQSFIMSEMVEFDSETKKNYFNTGSYNQEGSAIYRVYHNLDENDSLKGQQVKSSFDFHAITLHNCVDGSKKDVPIILIQENLGATERLDCVLFEISGKTGVYFQGGNSYEPDTDTIIGTSTYNGSTPRWAQVGQLVFLDGLGGFEIESSGFDSDRGGYFIVNLETPSVTNSKVQVTYNRHDYNLLEFFIDPKDVGEKSFIVAEKGFFNEGSPVIVGNPWVSEFIRTLSDTSAMLKLEWSDPLNKGDIVFQSGISFSGRFANSEINPIWIDEAETESGDSKDTSIVQKSYMGFEVIIEAVNQKQVTQLNIASALDGFTVNGLVLVRKKSPERPRMDKSNLYRWKCEFGFGENKLAIKENEIVFSPSTGVEGGGSTGKSSSVDLSNVTLFKDQNGNLVQTQGKLIKA